MKMEFFEALLIVMKIKECLLQNGFCNVYVCWGIAKWKESTFLIFISISRREES